MALVLSAALYALGAWAAALALLALLDRLPHPALAWAFSGASLLLIAGLVGLAIARDADGPAGAQAAFTCGLAAWVWQETAGAAHARARRRSRPTARASAAQELAWLVVVIGALALTWGGTNLAARWTVPALWGLHLSMRINALCAAHVGGGPLMRPPWFATGLPAAQLLSAVFPLTVTGLTAAATLAVDAALAPGLAAGEATGLALLGGSLAVGAARHWGTVVQLPALRTPYRALRVKPRSDVQEAGAQL